MDDSDYSELIRQLIIETNRIRTDPLSYAPKLENTLQYFQEDVLTMPHREPVQTIEGKLGYENAIETLKHQKSVNPLIENNKLSKVSKDLSDDIGPKGLISHDTSDGSTFVDRLEKHCAWSGVCCENIIFGWSSAEEIILSILVDDGYPEKNHRFNLFNPDVKYIGIGISNHKDYGIVTVCNYGENVRDPGEELYEKIDFTKNYLEKTLSREYSPKNPFQEEDPNAPDETTSIQMTKINKLINGTMKMVTKKIYTLSDKSQYIVEVINEPIDSRIIFS